MANSFQIDSQRFQEANRKREQIRKHRMLDHFNWQQSSFYDYCIQRRWIENGQNVFIKFRYMKELTKFLEQETGIKIKSTYKRYKKGLLKYIDDYFSVFRPILDSFSFPRTKDNFNKTPKKKHKSFIPQPSISSSNQEEKEFTLIQEIEEIYHKNGENEFIEFIFH
jgi:hypothetical protein